VPPNLSAMTDTFFDRVYTPMNQAETRDFYDEWAAQYETDIAGAGYATPKRAAQLLANIVSDKSTAVLDVGCGTGLSGIAFQAEGFLHIDGVDPSAKMLESAKSKRAYRELTKIEPGAPLPTAYAVIAAVGVIGCGAAPVTLFDDVMTALEPAGLFVLSLNDHALAVPEFMDKLISYTDTNRAVLLAEDYGPHLPDLGQNSMSKVFVLQKT